MRSTRSRCCSAISAILLTACSIRIAAQTPPGPSQSPSSPPHTVTCHLRTEPLSPGEVAFAQHDLPKAETLLTEESKATGFTGDRTHNQLIRVLLREEKFDQAMSDAQSWATAQPRNSWAQISLAEAQWRKGLIGEANHTIAVARNMDPCNPRAAMVHGQLLAFYGMNASAEHQFDIAHRLDPIDNDIGADWVRYQPRSVRLQSLDAYLAKASFLTEEQRKPLLERRDRLASPPYQDPCHLVSSVRSTAIPYAAIQNGPDAPTFWALDVNFNGKVRRLEIDTGAHGLMLTRSAANALHLDVEEKTKAGGIGDDGEVNAHISRVKSIRIGQLEFQDCAVEILETSSKGLRDQDGLIGADVFSQFLLTLDFPGRVLKLDPLPPRPSATGTEQSPSLETGTETADTPVRDRYVDPSMKDWTPFFRSGHHIILPVNLNNGPARLFIVDTGSQFNLVSADMAKQFAKVSKGSEVNLQGISGDVKQTYTTGPLSLTFAGLRQNTDGLIGMDTRALGRSAGIEITGLIGAPTLHQLTMQVDYRDDLIHFTFDPKRLNRCVAGVKMADCY